MCVFFKGHEQQKDDLSLWDPSVFSVCVYFFLKVKSSKDRAKLRLLLPKFGAEERGEAEALLEEWEEKSKQEER